LAFLGLGLRGDDYTAAHFGRVLDREMAQTADADISRLEVDLIILPSFEPLKAVKETIFTSWLCFELTLEQTLELALELIYEMNDPVMPG
jgi:hypothetical protein